MKFLLWFIPFFLMCLAGFVAGISDIPFWTGLFISIPAYLAGVIVGWRRPDNFSLRR
jgi:hypothetical protein